MLISQTDGTQLEIVKHNKPFPGTDKQILKTLNQDAKVPRNNSMRSRLFLHCPDDHAHHLTGSFL